MRNVLSAVAMLAALTAAAAADSVKFDPVTGTGLVNRGTIVAAFGPEAGTPEGAAQVSFVLANPQVWRSSCRQRPLLPKVVTTVERVRRERTDIAVEIEQNPQGQPTGFILDGRTSTVLVGRFCPPRSFVEEGATPELLSQGPSRLIAYFGERKKAIWHE